MKTAVYLLLALTVLTSCKKSSSDASPSSNTVGTDQGYGTLTFKGRTYYFQGYAYVPTANLGAAAGTALGDTTSFTVSMNLTPGPRQNDTTYHMAPQNQGALVYVMETYTTSSHKSYFYYFEKPSETLAFSMAGGKRSFTVNNLTETDQFGNPIANGQTLTATLKQK